MKCSVSIYNTLSRIALVCEDFRNFLAGIVNVSIKLQPIVVLSRCCERYAFAKTMISVFWRVQTSRYQRLPVSTSFYKLSNFSQFSQVQCLNKSCPFFSGYYLRFSFKGSKLQANRSNSRHCKIEFVRFPCIRIGKSCQVDPQNML